MDKHAHAESTPDQREVVLLLSSLVLDQVGFCREEVASFATLVQPVVADNHATSRQTAKELDSASDLRKVTCHHGHVHSIA